MDQQLKSNITSSKHWVRLVYMLLFAFFLYVASFVVGILVIVQFLFALITGSDNRKLRELGGSLTVYIKQMLLFLTFNSEFKAFPFADWPEPPPSEDEVVVKTEVENPPIVVPPPVSVIDVDPKPGDEGRPAV
jgi:hypothetical protein